MANGGSSSADLQASVVREPTGWKASGASTDPHGGMFIAVALMGHRLLSMHAYLPCWWCSNTVHPVCLMQASFGALLVGTFASHELVRPVQHRGSLPNLPSDMLPQNRRSLGTNQPLPDVHGDAIPSCCRPGVAWTCCA